MCIALFCLQSDMSFWSRIEGNLELANTELGVSDCENIKKLLGFGEFTLGEFTYITI